MASKVQKTAGRRKPAAKRTLEQTYEPATETVSAPMAKKSKIEPNTVNSRIESKCEEVADQKSSSEVEEEIIEGFEIQNIDKKDALAFGWTEQELTQLVTNVAACLPKIDTVKFDTSAKKLDWEKVRFSTYTADECKEKWMQISTKLRRFRTLTDLVTDATEWLKHPWLSCTSSKNQKHPDMPKKPLTPYFRYFLEKREKYRKQNPDMAMTDLTKALSKKFSQLDDKKKQKYKDSYEKENEIYKEELEKFKQSHPEQFPASKAHQRTGPEKPHTALSIFLSEKLKKPEYISLNPREARENLRKQWYALIDHKRIKWIKKAALDEERYMAEIEKYCDDHPDFQPDPVKPVLNKAEKELKNRFDGKPERPPNSGYSHFSRIMLREMKDIPSTLKMTEISKRWKLLGESEKEHYNQQAQKASAEYKKSYAVYLSKLPEKERKKIENEAKLPKKKRGVNDKVTAIYKRLPTEPRKPPQSGYSLFATEMLSKLTDLDPKQRMGEVAKRWKAMAMAEKDKYKISVHELMTKYDKDMEKFLASLSPTEIQEFQAHRKLNPKKHKGAVVAKKDQKKDSDSNSSGDNNDGGVEKPSGSDNCWRKPDGDDHDDDEKSDDAEKSSDDDDDWEKTDDDDHDDNEESDGSGSDEDEKKDPDDNNSGSSMSSSESDDTGDSGSESE